MPSDPPLPTWITPAHYRVLARLLRVFTELEVPYLVSGGLAGNLHGPSWPLHDIDVDVPLAALPRVAEAFSGHIRLPAGP